MAEVWLADELLISAAKFRVRHAAEGWFAAVLPEVLILACSEVLGCVYL